MGSGAEVVQSRVFQNWQDHIPRRLFEVLREEGYKGVPKAEDLELCSRERKS